MYSRAMIASCLWSFGRSRCRYCRRSPTAAQSAPPGQPKRYSAGRHLSEAMKAIIRLPACVCTVSMYDPSARYSTGCAVDSN
jgi:hypothetical protein